MSIHIIIDGYNLIRRSNAFSELDRMDIQRGREALIDSLARYKRIKKHRISVIFDGSGAPSFSAHCDHIKGVDIKFSRRGESADAVIKKMAGKLKEKALIVSSDRDITDHALLQGAAVISSPQFEKILIRSPHEYAGYDESETENGRNPTTKKKGPRRRLPKNKRRSRAKIQKL